MQTIPEKQHAHELIERLPDSQIAPRFRFLESVLLDPVARAVAAALDPTAPRLFEAVLRFTRTGAGDVNALQGDMDGAFRLRLGDYRVLFTLEGDAMRIFGVRHRSEAYG